MEGSVRRIESVGGVAQGAGSSTTAEGYRRLGIECTQSFLAASLEQAEEAAEWAKGTTAVPTHVRPMIEEIVHKLRRVIEETKGMV